ncbi:MAG: aminopeptidase P family protein [Bacillota bacterium]
MQKRIDKLKKLREKHDLDAVMITSKENRFYYSDFTGTAGILIITAEKNYFLTDFRYITQAKEQAKIYEIVEINREKEKKLVEFLQEKNINALGFEDNNVTYKYYHKLKGYTDDLNFVPLGSEISRFRQKKGPEEVARLEEAISLTEKAFIRLLDFIKPGLTEKEVAAELEYYLSQEGGEGAAFDFIVASGFRSALPHGVASDKVIENGEFVTFDFGAYYKGYCSDMTRTIVMGEASQKQQEVYNVVLEAHLAALEKIKPGMTGQEADKIARDIIRGNGYGDYFGHGLGHGLGIEVHEAPRLSPTSETILEPGMVVTDEPGIYIPDWGGVRIEDDLIITKNGCRSLNNSSKELLCLN